MRRPIICLLLAVGLLSACNNENKNVASSETATAKDAARPAPSPVSDLTETQTSELMNMLSAYYALKDALVKSDAASADGAAAKLLSTSELFKSGLGEQPQFTEIQPQLKHVMTGSEAIVNAKGGAEAIETKRQQFSGVSDAMYKIVKTANLRNAGVYHQFCPMAFNDKGGFWLSSREEIENPYLPKTMLHCGEVKDSL